MLPIIEVKNLSKEYILSHDIQPYYTLRDSLMGFLKKPFGFLFAKNSSQKKEKFLALDDINFSVMPGEVIGIIGRNGAGKSTLLKILSQITPPTSGSIHLRGRVASLLEVGTGFHPELTGRENIFLNGAILGMTRKEITKKFDEIVSFAGIDKFLDTPVKRYSSGMYVRLAFAVAAHLEPEILIVDEVLAVGDAEFQKKCLGKMGDIAKNDGRTVLFVSHNMAAIQQLCQKGIILSKGKMDFIGTADEAIDRYINMSDRITDYAEDGYVHLDQIHDKISKAKIFDKIRIIDAEGRPTETFTMLSSMKIEVELKDVEKFPGMDFGISILTASGQRITSYASWMLKEKKELPRKILLEIPKIQFSSGSYHIYLSMTHPKEGSYIDRIENAIDFHVESVDIFDTGRIFEADYGLVLPDGKFTLV